MTRNELTRRYPNASEAFIRLNLGADYVAPRVPRPEPKPTVQHEVKGPDEGKERSPSRFEVRIVSYRTRLLDADNLAGGCKFLIDALRYENLIPDDCPDAIELSISQVRVSKKLSERTEVMILPIEEADAVTAAQRFGETYSQILKEERREEKPISPFSPRNKANPF